MSEKLTVKNVVNINKSTLSAKDNWSTLKYLDTGNITENQIDTLQIFQKGEKLPSRAKRKVEKGTIIYSTVRPNQKHFGYFDTHSNDLVVSTGFATLDVIDPRINSKYLYYLLTQNSVISQLQSIGENSTSSYPSIRPEDIGNLSFVFPDIDIQNKIADILTSIDKKIQINNQINQELEAMAKTLYDYWFVQFDFPDQNGKPYKSSGGKMVYNPELKREIPEGWGVAKVEDIAQTGSGGTPKSTNVSYYSNGEIPWINSGELEQTVITSTSNFITEEGLNNSSAKLFPSGTILVAMYGATAGKVSFLTFEASTNQAICAIMLNDIRMRYYLKNVIEDLYQYLVKLSTGSARDNLSQDMIKNIKVVIPSNDILDRYYDFSNNIIKEITKKQQENEQLTQLRDWLLPMLMNGQVKVE
ncbi:restriction endonuclease subunit S [Streptococcus thermophilus]|nr:restriction endonuclease subunit S [Streptococcus thermophilus]MCE2197485.1 restriction endonuclease subunit S [Streptococcus thermophilus]MCE2203293.1 restriction endonuclease subunit S [Streptococcus thermophilus]